MRRRLSPEARRAEILEIARAAIASEGYRALTLAEIARRCGMSTPGLMHYFTDMPSLLAAVLQRRDEEDEAAIAYGQSTELTLLEALDVARTYYAGHVDEVRSFDTLEVEALDASHPAHDYFRERNERAFERLRAPIEREFAQPEDVLRLLHLLVDGLRTARLRAGTAAADDNDWRIALAVIDGQPRRVDR